MSLFFQKGLFSSVCSYRFFYVFCNYNLYYLQNAIQNSKIHQWNLLSDYTESDKYENKINRNTFPLYIMRQIYWCSYFIDCIQFEIPQYCEKLQVYRNKIYCRAPSPRVMIMCASFLAAGTSNNSNSLAIKCPRVDAKTYW